MVSRATYTYSHTIGFLAIGGDRGFNLPVDVAVSRDGHLYVLNRASPDDRPTIYHKRVTVCTVSEDYLGEFSTGGTGDGQLMWPVSIAIDLDGNVFISDEAVHRISVFDKERRFTDKWGVEGSGDGQFDRPAGIAFDSEDNLLVVDSLNARVLRFTKNGRFLGGWGSRGTGDGQFNMPWGIATDGAGDVYVADWRNDRIQKFDADGAHLATWGTFGRGSGQFSRPSGVAVDREGAIYVADWRNERVQVLDPDGSPRAIIRGQSGFSKWAQDYYLANTVEYGERQKADIEPEPEPPWNPSLREQSAATDKLLWGPISVKVDDEDRVYIVESCRHRIQVYQKQQV